MPEIHYSDALLTVIFGGMIGFGVWMTQHLSRLQLMLLKHSAESEKKISKLEKRLLKKIAQSNAAGAKIVRDYFDQLTQVSKGAR